MCTYSQPAALWTRPAASVWLPGVVLVAIVAPALAGAADDPAELLDVDVDELTRPRPLVADGRLETEPAESAHADPGQDPRDG